MSFTDDYLASRKKKKKEEKKTVSGGNSFTKEYLSKKDDIAPVKTTSVPQLLLPVRTGVSPTVNTFTAPVRPTTKAEDTSRKWFKGGAFDDGYQFGDVTKTILGTAGDAAVGVVKGIGYMGEGVADLISYGGAAVQDALGNDISADAIRERTAKSATDRIFGGLEKATDKYSVLGDKSDSVTQGLGQVATILATGGLAGAAGLGTVGATALTTGFMGASSAGSGMGEAYLGGATDEEAATYGLIKGVVDAGSELIFGGLGKAVKAVGLSKGLTSVDDLLAKKLSGKITNQIAKNFAEYGVKASAEGVEEVIAGVGSAMAKQATYMSDKELGELLKDENLMEQFVVGAVTSGIAQSGIVPGMKSGSLAEANKTGRDFITGLSTNEQQVIDKEVENRVAAQEKDGKKLTRKEKTKLYDSVVEDMDKGYISIDTIEEVLGGDTYKTYRETVDSEDALTKEFEELGNKQNATLAEQSRYNELKQQLEDLKQNSQRDTLKTKLSEEVFGIAKDSRLAESYAERDRRGQAFEADLTQYDAKQQEVVRRAAESGILNNTRRTHEFVDMIAKISADKGVLFDFTNNEKLKESGFAVQDKTVNGYVTKDGVTLNIDSAKSLNSVVGHEITHVLEGTELYTALQSAVTEYAKSKGEYQGRYDALTKLYEGVEGANVDAELTADMVGDYLFTDENFIRNLSVNNRNVFQKIYDEIKYLCKVATAGSKEARELEKVKRAFEKAYKEGGKTEGTKYSVSDSDYLSAVERGDMDTAQKMVDEAAKAAGYTQVGYHGTEFPGFTSFKGSLWLARDKDVARNYGTYRNAKEHDTKKPHDAGGVYSLFYRLGKNLYIEGDGADWSNLPVSEADFPGVYVDTDFDPDDYGEGYGEISTNAIVEWAQGEGEYDSVTFANIDDGGFTTVDVVLNPQRDAKSADPVTYDDNGNVIPLSERFNPKNEDIRYSLSDSDGKQLTREQQEYFKNSKARDESGHLQTVYHGTRNADFTVFKRNANYYTSSKETADSYAPSGAMYEGYVNITKPFVIDAHGEKWSGIAIDNDLKEMLESYGSSTFKERGKWRTTTADIVAAISDMVDEGEADYDGVIIRNVDDTGSYFKGKGGAIGTDYITFSSNQFKNVDNLNPTSDQDVRRSISNKGEAPVHRGRYNVFGKDIALDAPTVAENAKVEGVAPDIAPVTDNAVPDGFAPATEDEANAMRTEAFQTVDDADMPPETEAPYQPSQEVTVDDPFEDRDWSEVGNRKVKAYMYENPEVKPFFQEEAAVMLDELNSTTRGERWYDDRVYYDSGGEAGWGGTKRHTSDSIAEMLDNWHMSYDDIEKGLKAIIEDHGAENIAAAKKIEFMLNDRLLNGYTSFVGWEPTKDRWGNVPPSQSYLATLEEKQITEYSKEAFEALVADADRYAPVGIPETAAPVVRAKNATTTADDFAPVYEVVSNKKGEIKGQQAITKEDAATGKTAQVLVEEPEVEKKQSAWSKFKNLVLDKGMVFEDLSIRTGNRELQARWNSIRYARNKAQRLMEKGNASVSSLDSIRKTVEGKGKEYTQKFYEYLYHMHNIDRMSLETKENRVKREELQVQFKGYTDDQLSDLATSWITKDTPQETVDRIKAAREYVDVKKGANKPVFGDDVTADISRKAASKMEKANPEFKEYAQEVYGYMNYLREMLVDSGVISNETAKLWDEMYPHYVPIRRLGDTGLNINVPLDTGRTGVNAPIKRATGGSRDILPLFDTMGQRTMQTFSAVAKNRFGVELKNTLGTTIGSEAMGLDDAIDSIDAQDGLLQEGKKGKKPTFTVFEDGKRVTFEITEEMYDAMKPTSDALAYTNKVASAVSDFRRNTLTQYNPWFMLKNAIKDAQDVLINSQHATRTYATIPKAISQMVSNGQWYTEYMENGGEDNSYFDSQTNTFEQPNPTIEAIKKYTGLNAIAKANNIIERLPRLAEYIASREAGRSVDVAMLDAARVTTNFAAGGDLTKFLNRNGATFLNASFQGAMQQVRNVREAKAAGVKGVLNLAAKFAVAGLPAIALNALIWGDDDEYEELSDYVKQSYYIVGKTEDGKFIRIPKGRTVAVIQNGFEQMQHLITGDDEADLRTFLDLLLTNLAPNNPLDNNILSPIIDVAQNKTWYGEDLVPTRLQDVPNAEQYDESTDSLSRWLGETFNVSPYKTNYLLDQYGGIIGDTFLPMLTPEAESGNNTFAGNLIAPLKDMFTADSVMNNQNVSDFYDTKDELTKAANSMYATDEDVLKAKYMNSVNSEMGKLYGEKRELQNSDMPDAEKYEAVREVQRQIDELAKSGLDTYNEVLVSGGYATVGDRHYRKKDGEWSKLTDEQLEKQEEVTSGLGISPADYWSDKEEYDFAYEKPEKYAVAKAVGGYTSYKDYSDELYDIKSDKDENGDSIRNSRKEKVIDWVNNLDADYGTKIILFKNEYNADDTYNYDIIEYLNNRDDISYEEMEAILKELGFDVDENGNISWD